MQHGYDILQSSVKQTCVSGNARLGCQSGEPCREVSRLFRRAQALPLAEDGVRAFSVEFSSCFTLALAPGSCGSVNPVLADKSSLTPTRGWPSAFKDILDLVTDVCEAFPPQEGQSAQGKGLAPPAQRREVAPPPQRATHEAGPTRARPGHFCASRPCCPPVHKLIAN